MTPIFIAILKCSKHNYQLDQVLENFEYSFYFDGITLRTRGNICLFLQITSNCTGTKYCEPCTFAKQLLYFCGVLCFVFQWKCFSNRQLLCYQRIYWYVCHGVYGRFAVKQCKCKVVILGLDATLTHWHQLQYTKVILCVSMMYIIMSYLKGVTSCRLVILFGPTVSTSTMLLFRNTLIATSFFCHHRCM